MYVPLLGIYLVVLLGLLLWPFDFSFLPGASARWLSADGAIELVGNGGVRSREAAVKIYKETPQDKPALSVEVIAATATLDQEGPARIVSYSEDELHRNFTLGQEADALVVRLRTTKTDLNGTNPHVVVPGVFRKDAITHIVVTYDGRKVRIYINGKTAKVFDGPGGDFGNWNPTHRLVLGNENNGNRAWNGRLYAVAIYNRTLREAEVESNAERSDGGDRRSIGFLAGGQRGLVTFYTFEEGRGQWVRDVSGQNPPLDLEIVSGPVITGKALLASPFAKSDDALGVMADTLANIALFVPVGFMMMGSALRGRSRTWAVVSVTLVAGVAISFTAEVLQAFLFTRHSDWADVITNGSGTALGVAAFLSFAHRART